MSGEALLVYENNTLDPPASTAIVLGIDLAFAAAIGVAVWQRARARRAAAEADASVVADAPLFEGQRFVAGRAELAAGEAFAVRVTVTQSGAERVVKQTTVHDWIEIERAIEARPFYLVHASGARVRVEVPEPAGPNGVRLVDALDQREHLDRARRRLRAEITPGERVIVEGRLAREHDPEGDVAQGYREGGRGWVLRAPRGRPMLLSTEELGRPHRLRHRALLTTIVLMGLAWIVAEVPLAGHRLRQLRGEDVVATYAGKRSYDTVDGKGRRTTHWMVDVVDVDRRGAPVDRSEEVDRSDWDVLPAEPARIRLRRVASAPWATALGRGSAVAAWQIAIALAACVAAWLGLRSTLGHKRWFDRELSERNRTGPLPRPNGQPFRTPEDAAPRVPHVPRGASPKAAPVR